MAAAFRAAFTDHPTFGVRHASIACDESSCRGRRAASVNSVMVRNFARGLGCREPGRRSCLFERVEQGVRTRETGPKVDTPYRIVGDRGRVLRAPGALGACPGSGSLRAAAGMPAPPPLPWAWKPQEPCRSPRRIRQNGMTYAYAADSVAEVAATAEALFDCLDDQAHLGARRRPRVNLHRRPRLLSPSIWYDKVIRGRHRQ